jgi:regulator of protease activity HflC (stomatin/prohibitin superfamily)
MFFVVLGALLVFLAGRLKSIPGQGAAFAQTGRYIGLAMIILGIFSACFVQIEAGQVGVPTLFGKIQNNIVREGLNVINPLWEIKRFDVRTQNYTMSGVHDEGDKMGDDAIRALSSDGLEVVIDLTVLYRIQADRTPDVLRTIGEEYREKIVRPVTRTKVRDYAAYYDAVSLYSSKRDEFQSRLIESFNKEFGERGLVLESVLIRNIALPASVKAAIEQKINAEQESQKMKFVLDKERQEADRKRVEAQGIADYQRILTSSLTDKLLQYEQIKAQKDLAASNNAKVIVLGGKGNTPIILGQ